MLHMVDGLHGRVHHTGTVVEVPAGLFEESETVVVHCAEVVNADGGLKLIFGQQTWVTVHPMLAEDSFVTLKEICAGMGGIGLGGSIMNMRIVAQLDHNGLCCSVLRQNGSPCVLQADIGSDDSIKLLHQVQPHRRHVLTAGFPCQPFSSQGMQLAMLDRRSSVFFRILKAAYLMAPSALLLECVPGVANHAAIRRGLDDLAQLLDYHFVTVVMDLNQIWPCARKRWWALMVPKQYDVQMVQAWHFDEQYRRVDSLIPRWPLWPADHEAQLRLSEHELELYHNPRYGQEERLLSQSRPAPTFLHSYGNGHDKCPCGCRARGFSKSSLEQKGFRGVYVRSELDDQPRLLHPRELGLLIGFPDTYHYPKDLREGLCLLGQSASPLQAAWMFGQLQALTGLQKGQRASSLPQHVLQRYRAFLKQQSRLAWPLAADWDSALVCIKEEGVPDVFLVREGQQDVASFIRAERKLQEGGVGITVSDGYHIVSPAHILKPMGNYGPLRIQRTRKTAETNLASSSITITMVGIAGRQHAVLPSGSFLFEALWQLELHTHGSYRLYSEHGILADLDERQWRSATFCMPPGCGPNRPSEGVTLAQMHQFLEHINNHLGYHTGPVEWILTYHLEDLFQGLGKFSQHLQDQERAYAICWHAGHWFLLEGRLSDDCLHLIIWDGASIVNAQFSQGIGAALAEQLEVQKVVIQQTYLRQQTFTFSCGATTLLHLARRLGLIRAYTAQDEILLHRLLHQLPARGNLRGAGWEGQDQEDGLMHALQALLSEKGVPQDRVQERAHMALKKLGKSDVQSALNTKQPWATLKAMGKRQHTSFQFVKHDELQIKIREKEQSTFGISKSGKTHKTKERKIALTALKAHQLNPDLLEIIPDTFVGQDGSAVVHLDGDQLRHGASGLAISTVPDLLPHLREGKTLSEKPLAVLTVGEVPDDVKGFLAVTNIRYPVFHAEAKEAILVTGSLVQLGELAILRKEASKEAQVHTISTQVIKVVVYKDQWPSDWATFVVAPVKSVIDVAPTFMLCNASSCGPNCGRFHAPCDDEDIETVIMDVWSRGWHTVKGQKSGPLEADIFSCLMRIPDLASTTLQQLSGQRGIYVEPRDSTGRSTDNQYGVIWLQGMSFREATCKQAATPKVVALVRKNERYGLRFTMDQMEKAHKEIRPDAPFEFLRFDKVYHISPLPHGTQRPAVQKLLKVWKWAAKPLQPKHAGPHGITWEVGSSDEPPSQVLQHSGGDVVITQVTKEMVHRPAEVHATAKASRHIQKAASSTKNCDATEGGDPWQQGRDPWATWFQAPSKTSASSSTTTKAAVDRVQQVEQRIRADVKAVVRKELEEQASGQDVAMYMDNHGAEHRFSRIEADLGELRHQNAKFEQWFAEAGAANHNTATRLQSVAEQVGLQQQEITALNSSFNGLRSQMQEDMQTGFGRLEALLSKKSRTE